MIEDMDVERALDFLRDSAKGMGSAKAETIRRGHMVKHTRALMMKQFNGLSAAAQLREAEASGAYLIALEADAVAAGEYETLKSLREAASMRIEAWRSASANYRAMKL